MISVKVSTHKQVDDGWMIYLVTYIDGVQKYKSTGLIVSKRYSSPLKHKRTGKVLRDKQGKKRYPKILPMDKESWELAKDLARIERADLIRRSKGLPDEKKLDSNFIEYFENIAKEKNNNSYNGALYQLKKFAGKRLSFRAINYEYLKAFQKALSYKVSNRTVNTYIQRLNIAWKEAIRLGYVRNNPFEYLKGLKVKEKSIKYLKLNELEALINCNTSVTPIIQLAFLFACYTGLRYSDIKTLKWEHIRTDIERPYLKKLMKKGGTKEIKIPLIENAREILAMLDKRKDFVFAALPDRSTINKKLKLWAKDASITNEIHQRTEREISFHWSRHTFAALARYYDIDIHTLQKLMAHSNISHTQIYASLYDETKQEAMDKMKIPTLKIKKLKVV